ncbi:hypothetical protein ACOSP7_013351 [Xanthoceras sorbifolium]
MSDFKLKKKKKFSNALVGVGRKPKSNKSGFGSSLVHVHKTEPNRFCLHKTEPNRFWFGLGLQTRNRTEPTVYILKEKTKRTFSFHFFPHSISLTSGDAHTRDPSLPSRKSNSISKAPTPASKLLFSRFQTKKSLLSSLLQHYSKLISSPLLCFSKLLSPLRSSLLSCRVDVAPLQSPVAAIGKTSHG